MLKNPEFFFILEKNKYTSIKYELSIVFVI